MSRATVFLLTPGALGAFLKWRPFSLTNYHLVRELIRTGVRPALVIDVGANAGQFSRAIRENYGPDVLIVGYEPCRVPYRRLIANFRGDNFARFEQTAIADCSGTGELFINSYSQSSSMLRLGSAHISAFPSAREIGSEAVQMRQLDEVLQTQEWRAPVLLKIDVQGYELHVLKGAGAVLAKTDYVVIEIGLVPLYEDSADFNVLNETLEAAGFSFKRSLAHLKAGDNGAAIQSDVLYCKVR